LLNNFLMEKELLTAAKWGRVLMLVAGTTLLAYCSSTRQSATLKASQFDLQGHRGCRGLMPENTIPAMLKALEWGVTTLEMDVVITADSVVLLSHEPFFNHEISSKPGGERVSEAEERSLNIYSMTYAQTQQYDVGMVPHPRFPEQQKMKVSKPALRDVLAAVQQYCATRQRPLPKFNIETKSQPATDAGFHPAPERFVQLLMQVVDEAGVRPQVIIQSFDFRTLQVLHRQYPDVKTAALVEADDALPFAQQLKKLGFIPTIYSPAYQLVDALLVRQCNEMGIQLIPWTVNDPAEAIRLRRLGVAGLITDYPDRIKNGDKM
jgi:glycerophosphoryl diester phosphodiesterase